MTILKAIGRKNVKDKNTVDRDPPLQCAAPSCAFRRARAAHRFHARPKLLRRLKIGVIINQLPGLIAYKLYAAPLYKGLSI